MDKNYINVLHKIAWSFHHTTGLEWEELFGEAQLAYVKAEQNYDPEKAAFSTYLFSVVTNHLLNYAFRCKRQYIVPNENPKPVHLTPEVWYAFRESIANLGKDARIVCRMILDAPTAYASLSQTRAERAVRNELAEAGWSERRRKAAFREIKNLIACS